MCKNNYHKKKMFQSFGYNGDKNVIKKNINIVIKAGLK